MSDEREIRPGWLPPKPATDGSLPPAQHASGAHAEPPRPTFVQGRPAAKDGAPSSPLAVSAIVLSAIGLVLLVLSVGVAWGLSSILSLLALSLALTARRRMRAGQPAREGQLRVAMIIAIVGLVLAAIAAAVWLGLESNGITPQDLQDWLQRELERRQSTPAEPGRTNTVQALVLR